MYVSHRCIFFFIPGVATSRRPKSQTKIFHNTLRLSKRMRLMTHFPLFWSRSGRRQHFCEFVPFLLILLSFPYMGRVDVISMS